jgi:hybrid cluster-associated redox disulfide protein
MRIDSDALVEDVMQANPATIQAFLRYRMSCVGCPIASFHTVEDACREHGIAAADFLAALRASAQSDAAHAA